MPIIVHGSSTGIANSVIELNKRLNLKFWRGTKAEYDALETKSDDVMYIITDELSEGSIPITSTPGDDTKVWIDPTEDDDSSYYTVSDVDTLLNNKADTSSVYTKTEADGLLQNKAPAGFGLGTYGKYLGANDDLNNITKNGWYSWSSDIPANAITEWSAMFVSAINDGHIVQTIYPFSMPGTRIIRVCTGSIWKPDEYENPPMQLGVEYRTTERYLGNPVYAMAVDFGNLPNATTKEITVSGVSSPNKVVSVFGCIYGGKTIPTFGLGWGSISTTEDAVALDAQAVPSMGLFIHVTTRIDRSNLTAVIYVKYTKSTD